MEVTSFILLLVLVGSCYGLTPELKQARSNITVSEVDISDWLKRNAPINSWDRPVKNYKTPMIVHVKLGITSFALIVSPEFILYFTYYYFFLF